MAMSCLLRIIVLWHLSKATKLFLISCVHYNYKCVTNLVVDFQFFSTVIQGSFVGICIVGTHHDDIEA
jgi:hypothetical protein